MSRNAFNGENGKSCKNLPEGWRKFQGDIKSRALYTDAFDENVKFDKNENVTKMGNLAYICEFKWDIKGLSCKVTILAKMGNVTKSANLAENLPWVLRIFKLDGKRAPAL